MSAHFKKRLVGKFLSTTACFVVVAAFAHESFAAPEGSLVVGGSALVTQTGLDTVIQQNSNRAIIRWNSFDVAQNEKVRFEQPSANSITVNRITDTKASKIDGNISANGKLVMINPNGIVFGATSRVDVGSLVATSSDLEDDASFMAGGPANFKKSGNPNAKIINAGTITARDAGLVGLVAPNVENSGVIQARLGKVHLASGDIHTIDLAGDGLIKIEVSDAVISQSVKNTGTLQADGGEILMTAAQGRAALDAVISNHGRIQTGTIFATDAQTGTQIAKKGKITITAPTNKESAKTTIVNAGTVVADGGTVQMIADTINLKSTSNISVASENGGGSVFIGGARQGGTALPTAQFVNVDEGSIIDASAWGEGNGGNVVIWSNMRTNFGGKIIATGGTISGNGGEVEVSGKNLLNYYGFTDLRAKNGIIGNLLLDPTDILITSAADQNISGSSPFTPTVDDGPSILSVATLTAALGSASVTVQTSATGTQQGNITVDAPINWSSGNTLTLDAHHDIIINQAIAGQNLTLIAGNDVQINAALSGTGIITIMPASDAQTIGIGNGSVGTLQITTPELSNIINGWSQIVFGRTTGTGQMDVQGATWNDNLLLRSDTGQIHIGGVQNLGANDLSLLTNAPISITAALAGAGTLSISSLTSSVGMGIGTGQAGGLQLTNSDLSFIADGWSSIIFGNASMTGDLNVGTRTWMDNLVLQTGAGTLSINGTQNLGANNLQIIADSNPVIAGDLIGTGSLTFMPGSVGLTVGVGAGASGVFNIDAAEFAHVRDGWSQIYLGRIDSTALMDLRALSWLDRVRIYAGAGIISINGAQNFGANQTVFQTDGDIELNASLSGTGQLAFLSNLTGTSMGLADEAGTINLTTAELNQIQNGFSVIQFGSGSTPLINPITVGAYTWQDNVMFTNTTGVISFTGAQNFGNNDLTIRTDADLNIGATLSGTGTLTIAGQSNATGIGLGTGQTGTIQLSDSELSNIADGWNNIIIGLTSGTGAVNVGTHTWNDNLTLNSGSGLMTIAGAQMGANNLSLNTANDIVLNGNLSGTGTLTIQGSTVSTTMGFGTGQAGTLSLNNTELGYITDGWTNIILGRTDGTGAINIGANTWNDSLELRSNTGAITISGTQNMGANNLTITTGADPAINAALTGTGTLTLRGANASTIMGIGTGQTGVFQLNNAELANLTNGWGNIIIGRTDGTGSVNVGANTWNDNLTLQSSSGIITIAGAQNMGSNNLTISTDTTVMVNAALTGTGTLNLLGNSAGTTMAFGTGQTGSFYFDTAAVGNITNGWSNIIIGRTDGTGAINIGALTWSDDLTLQSGSASININGIQTLGANNVTFTTDGDPQINAAMNSTGILTFQGVTDATTIGVGTGQAGTLSLSTTDLTNADNTWSSIVIGRTTQTGAINVGGFTLVDPLTLQSATGTIAINAAINMGANNLTIQTDADPIINATLTGTGNLNILPMNNTTTIGVGNGSVGTISIDDAEQARIQNGWANIVIGRTTASGAITVGSNLTWQDNLFLRTTGAVTINGTQNLVNNSFSLQTNSDPTFNGTIAGTGGFTLSPIATNISMGFGDGQAGIIHLSNAELDNILNGWASLTFGLATSTAAVNVGTYTWSDNLTIRSSSGLMSINGNQNMGGNNLTLQTDSNLALNGALTGTGTLTITPGGNTSIGIGTGQAGTLQLSDAELANITNGWTSVVFGSTVSTGAINVGANTWQDNVTIRNGNGIITIAGDQNTGSNNLTIQTDNNLAINAALTGTGTLTIAPSANTTMGIGTGQTGTLQLNDTELSRITDGWNSIVLGSTASTAAVNVGLRTWNDNLTLNSGSGQMTIAGVQMGANNLNIQTDSNLAITGGLAGTGALTIRAVSNGTTMSLGTATGTLNLSNSELAYLTDGWNRITFGHTGATGAMNIGAATWRDNIRLITNTGAITVNGVQDFGNNNLEILTNADPTFNATVTGSGTLTVSGASNATTIGIGDGQTGTLQLSNADLAYLSSGWHDMIFGSNAQTGAMNIGPLNWQYNATFRTGSGLMTVAGATNVGSHDLTLETDSNLAINAPISGTGILTIRGSSNATSMGIGTGQTGTLQLSDAELNQITDGWHRIILGQGTATGAVNVGARTWTDNLHLLSGAGQMNINGIQNMGANNLTLETDSNLAINAALNGTGQLTVRGASTATTIGVNGAAGTLALSTAEIANMTDGWGSVMIGRHDMTGAISLGTATWLNPTTFMTRGDVNVSGVQTSTETSGTSLVFVSQSGVFNNTAGASAINPGGGRYLIYAVDAASANLNGLSPPTTINAQTYFSLYPADVVPTGDIIIYSTGAPRILLIQIDDKSKVYGDANPNFTYTFLGGLQGSDLLSDALTGYTLDAAGTSLTDNAGTTWAITGSFMTGLGYSVNVLDGTMTVTRAPVLVQINPATRAYGAADPAYTYSYIGLKNGENASVIDTLATASTPATILSNVGTYSLTSLGAADGNYVFNYGTSTLTITKADLTVTADNKTRAYGDANPALTMSYSGFVNGDSSTSLTTLPTLSTTATSTTSPSNVAITLAGGTDSNYNLVLVNGVLTITKADLAITADNKTREYGDANPALTYTFGSFKNGETASVLGSLPTISTAATGTTNVGTAAITLSGGSDTNYNYVFTNGVLTITKTNLVITADNKTREYGDANPALTYTFGSFKNGETSAVLGSLPTISTTATGTTNVGTTAITLAGGSDGNYNYVLNNGTLTITKATLTATAQNASRDYGDANPALNVIYTGFKNGEDFNVIDTLATASTTATGTTNAGTAVISAAGANDGNYNFVYLDGVLTINKANLSVTADNKTRIYGDANPALTYTFGSFKNGETSAVLGSLPTISTTATGTTNVGTAAITLSGGSDTNYNYVFTDGILTITKADLAITADDKTRAYGDANPALTYSFSGFQNGEDFSVLGNLPTISTAANLTTNVGTAAITLSGGSDGNYNYILNDGTLTIIKATLTATAQNASRDYGDANPALSVLYTGFKNGENSGVIDTLATASTTATNTTNAGAAVISASGANDSNYDFVYVDGVLTINKANLTVTADNKTREYGDANPTLTYTYGPFKNGETSAVLGTAPTISTAANLTTNAGTSAITLSGGSDTNYNYVFTDGVLTITKAAITVQIDDATRAEGEPNPAFTYTVLSGLKNGDPNNVLSNVIYTSATDKYTPRGDYVLNGSGGVATNYYVSNYLSGTLTITPGDLPIKSLPSTVYYSNALGSVGEWDKWRDLLYYEDDSFIETILFGRQVIHRDYSEYLFQNNVTDCDENLGNICQSQI